MKRLIRSEKNKLIERAKTLVIALLFLLSLMLGYRILKLYKDQTNIDRTIWGGTFDGAEVLENNMKQMPIAVCERPEAKVMLLNSYAGRTVIDARSQTFEDISHLANLMIGQLYEKKADLVQKIKAEEWQRAQNADSVYIKYPLKRYVETDVSFYGMKSSDLKNSLNDIEEVTIEFDQSDDDAVILYASGQSGDAFLKTEITGEVAREFKKKVKKLDKGEKKSVVFAWELGLDEKAEKGTVILDPMVMVNTEEVKTRSISVSVPKLYKSGLNFTAATDMTLGLIEAFNYNPNTIRQYVGSDNSIIFVGETGSLSLHPDGVIEYKALDSDDGVLLSTGEGLDGIMSGLCGMIEKIMRIGGINTSNAAFKLKMTSVGQRYAYLQRSEFGFDYFVGDKKVELLSPYGVFAVVQKGRLVELKMNLKDIRIEGKDALMDSTFVAIDKFMEENGEVIKINDVYGVYVFKEGAEDIAAMWRVE